MSSLKWIKNVGNNTRCALFATCLAFVTTNVLAQNNKSNEPLSPLSSVQLTQLNVMLTDKLRQYANSKRWFEGQVHDIRLTAEYNIQTQTVTVDLGEEFGPDSLSAGMEDLQEELGNEADQVLMGVATYRSFSLRFGGKDMYYWYPQERRDPPQPVHKSSNPPITIGPIFRPDEPFLPSQPKIVVSAGHGYYYDYNLGWTAQRDPSNGIVEDLITPIFATELNTWLTKRSSVDVSFSRSTETTIHLPSGKPWWQVAARYNLQQLYPNNPEIWHSLPNSTSSQRERLEDINSRPLFANYIGSSAIISIHTNASDPSASGTRVFYQAGRVADQ